MNILAETKSHIWIEVPAKNVADFAARWPCSGLPDDQGVVFGFDKRNGDLIEIEWSAFGEGEPEGVNDGAVLALSYDAQKFAGLGDVAGTAT